MQLKKQKSVQLLNIVFPVASVFQGCTNLYEKLIHLSNLTIVSYQMNQFQEPELPQNLSKEQTNEGQGGEVTFEH